MNRRAIQNLLLVLVATCIGLLMAELVLRILAESTESRAVRVFNVELPPLALIPDSQPTHDDRSQWYDELVVDGRRITIGDLWGYHRSDPVLGYVPQEEVVSDSGWWQSNNLGARRRSATLQPRSPSGTRILVFGDSFTHCSRVPQEETWPHHLEQVAADLEVVNFGVDGYSMAQSFLRYRSLPERLEHDLVLFVLVPTVDLWRDINVLRALKEPWGDYIVMPRFILAESGLQLVEPLYADETELFQSNAGVPSTELLDHLQRYDRFYFQELYVPSSLVRHVYLAKLLARGLATFKKKWLLRNLRSPDSEAMQVVTEVYRGARQQAAARGARIAWVILPAHLEVEEIRQSRTFRREWAGLVSHFCGQEPLCIDLSTDLVEVDAEALDFGFDGTHYGPRTNRLIASFLARRLEDLGLMERGSPGALESGDKSSRQERFTP